MVKFNHFSGVLTNKALIFSFSLQVTVTSNNSETEQKPNSNQIQKVPGPTETQLRLVPQYGTLPSSIKATNGVCVCENCLCFVGLTVGEM